MAAVDDSSGSATVAAGSVRAVRADRHDVRALARRERLENALWPVPTLFGIGALVVAVLTIIIDDALDLRVHGDRFLVGDTDTALTLTSVVATGMLAFLGIVFATTLVAIQLAASQYSPRAVRVFVRSRLTKVSLGVFVATFVFSIVTLIAIRSADRRGSGFTPVLSTSGVAVLVIATLVAFLFFANGTARLLRVQYLVERIADETRPTLLVGFPSDTDVLDAVPVRANGSLLPVAATTHGVLDAIDVGDLAVLAARIDGWIEVTMPIGAYVVLGAPIAVIHPRAGEDAASSTTGLSEITATFHACLLFSNERTLLQDPGFGFRQLVDIAIRALSPSVNDPTTAVQVVDRITDLLGRVANRPAPTGWYADADGTARVHLVPDTFAEVVTLAFTEIIRYGADSPQVVRRLRAAFDDLEARGATPLNAAVRPMRQLLDETVDEIAVKAFTHLGETADPRGLG
jgi:uncharacterized membrane protein